MDNITPEMARAELQRRSQAKNILDQRQQMYESKMQQDHPFAYNLAKNYPRLGGAIGSLRKPLEAINSVIYPLGMGVGQEVGDIGASIANIPAATTEFFTGKRPYNVPHPDFEKKLEPGLKNKLLFGGGQLLADIPALMAGEGLIGSGLGKLGETLTKEQFYNSMYPSLLNRMGAGALTGAAIGENKEGGGRALNAALGGILPLASEIPIFKRQAEKPFKKTEEVLRSTGLKGFNLSPETKADFASRMKMESVKPVKEELQDLFKKTASGEYKDLHNLQSRIGKISSKIYKQDELQSHLLGELRKKIINDMQKHAFTSGAPEAAAHMIRGQKQYKQYKELQPYVKKVLKYLGGGALGGGAAGIGYNLGKQAVHSFNQP